MKLLHHLTPLALLMAFLSPSLFGQDIRHCGWSVAEQSERKRNPGLFEIQKTRAEERIRTSIQDQRIQSNDTLYTLPVVVHVIHTGNPIGSPGNPSDADIHAMIDKLNESFRKDGGQYGGVDVRLKFQLATRSPQCGPTTGINRVDGSSVADYVSGGIAIDTLTGYADEWAVKALSRWPNTDYINIWVVHKILGTATGIGGFAYFAEYNRAYTDGITINAAFVNGNNETITHEMGHVFNMYHTFYDDGFEDTCPRTDSCIFYADRVCDTEGGLLETDCMNTTNACTGLPYVVADMSLGYTVLNNYMNYTNCAAMFTQGQKDRIRATLFAFRASLISSGALSPPPASSPSLSCEPVIDNGKSDYYGVEKVEFNTLSVYSNSSVADSASYIDRTCNQRTSVVMGQTYPLTVRGSFFNPCWIKAFIDYNNDGDFDDPGETLISTVTFTGTETVDVTIPATGITNGTPLRLRIISDHPATEPSACHLSGDAVDGAGQVEDYAVIVANRQIVSAATGDWNVASTWTCNCIPQPGDEVIIKPGHTVSITPAMGPIECVRITLEAGSVFNVSGSFKTTGN